MSIANTAGPTRGTFLPMNWDILAIRRQSMIPLIFFSIDFVMFSPSTFFIIARDYHNVKL